MAYEVDTKVYFLPGSSGNLFTLYFTPSQIVHNRAILYIPPFAEEMNKARRMATLQAYRFAHLGYGVLSVDLYGTGDSEGNFADAHIELWLDNMCTAVSWLINQGIEKISLWGLRFGCLLAVKLLSRLDSMNIDKLILWQPVVRGEQLMTQFLRLRTAAELVSGEERLSVNKLRNMLEAGKNIEVAGYELSLKLVKGIDALTLPSEVPNDFPETNWIEIASQINRLPGPASTRIIHAWTESGASVSFSRIAAPSFWNTPEITAVPELLDKSSCLMN